MEPTTVWDACSHATQFSCFLGNTRRKIAAACSNSTCQHHTSTIGRSNTVQLKTKTAIIDHVHCQMDCIKHYQLQTLEANPPMDSQVTCWGRAVQLNSSDPSSRCSSQGNRWPVPSHGAIPRGPGGPGGRFINKRNKEWETNGETNEETNGQQA